MVAPRARCPRCGNPRSWILRNGRRRCARCRFDWRPGRLPLRLTPQQWRELLRWFVRGAPSAQIADETRLNRKRVLRALTSVRRAILRSCPGNRRHVTDVAPGSRPKERHDAGRHTSAKHLRRRVGDRPLHRARVRRGGCHSRFDRRAARTRAAHTEAASINRSA